MQSINLTKEEFLGKLGFTIGSIYVSKDTKGWYFRNHNLVGKPASQDYYPSKDEAIVACFAENYLLEKCWQLIGSD
jgi:hypothetical protein